MLQIYQFSTYLLVVDKQYNKYCIEDSAIVLLNGNSIITIVICCDTACSVAGRPLVAAIARQSCI
jgi:hypothetical protein